MKFEASVSSRMQDIVVSVKDTHVIWITHNNAHKPLDLTIQEAKEFRDRLNMAIDIAERNR